MAEKKKQEDVLTLESLKKQVDDLCAAERRHSDNWRRFVKRFCFKNPRRGLKEGEIGNARAGLLVCMAVLVATIAYAGTKTWTPLKASVYGDVNITGDTATKVTTVTADYVVARSNLTGNAGDRGASAGATGVTVTERDYGNVRQTTITAVGLTFTNKWVGPTTNVAFGIKLYDAPEGIWYLLGATMNNYTMTTGTTHGAGGGDVSFGTTAATTNFLTGTEVDIIPSTSFDPFTSGVSNKLASAAQFDGSLTAKDVYANLMIDVADIGTDRIETNQVNFELIMTWIDLGPQK